MSLALVVLQVVKNPLGGHGYVYDFDKAETK